MNQVTERKLLYYDRFQEMPRHYYGLPIFHFSFQDVKTGENVTLGSCYFAEELSDITAQPYYEDIDEATKDFDILWNISDEGISPVANTFDEVQAEYQRLIKEGVSLENINSTMITLFQQKTRTRIRN